MQLRPYQEKMVQETRQAFSEGASRVLLVAPTGGGKGSIASHIIQGAVAKGNRVSFVVNRKELVKDMSKRLKRLSIPHGIMQGANTHGSHHAVQVCSIDTLRNRIGQIGKLPELVFNDEAHLSVSTKAKDLLNQLAGAGARVIHMTATPCRLDGKGLKEIADKMVQGPSVSELITQGYLVPPVVYAPSTPDLSGVTKTAGEYNQGQVAEVMGQSRLIGDIVTHWKELAYGRKTVVFCVNRKHAQEVSDSFVSAGIKSVAVDANTPDNERDSTWHKLATGQIPVVCSVGIISYGWDVPEVDCIILARPTLSLALHLQQCGRGLRISDGKDDCLILDHAGNTLRHGLPEDERRWTLQGRKKKALEESEVAPLPVVCPKCSKVVKKGTQVCQCGYKFSYADTDRAEREIKVDKDGKLQRVESRVYIYPETTGDLQKDSIIGVASTRNYNPGWIKHQSKILDSVRAEYKAEFGEEPKAHWNAGQIKSMLKQVS